MYQIIIYFFHQMQNFIFLIENIGFSNFNIKQTELLNFTIKKTELLIFSIEYIKQTLLR